MLKNQDNQTDINLLCWDSIFSLQVYFNVHHTVKKPASIWGHLSNKYVVLFTEILKIGEFSKRFTHRASCYDSTPIIKYCSLFTELELLKMQAIFGDNSFKWKPARAYIINVLIHNSNQCSLWWNQNLWRHAQAKAIMITIVGVVGRQLETGQQSMRITNVDMVNPATSSVGGTSHKLLEA